jgi:hypothetical protein
MRVNRRVLGASGSRLAGVFLTTMAFAAFAACDGAATNPNTTRDELRVCDGSVGVTLAARVAGGGQVQLGRAMQAENGWELLLVTGTCEAWVLPSESQPLRHLTLARAQERALIADLRVDHWAALAVRSPTGTGCADASSLSYRFNQLRFLAPGCGLDSSDELALVNAAFSAKVLQWSAAGSPAEGDVRYLLIEGDATTASDRTYQSPAIWPLAIMAATVALPRDQIFTQPFVEKGQGRSQRASGDDARALRALRDRALAGQIGDLRDAGFIAVVTPAGQRFELYVRDASPFEGADGLIPTEVF